jgi:phenylalanyl-tRNA synthetase beta chain
MKIPISWIKNYIDFNISNEDVSELLTMSGTEVSDIIKIGNDWDSNLIVGEIKNIKKHPNADRLSLVSIDTATDLIEVVCGAPNITPGQKIAFARPGANIYNPRDKKMSILKKSSIRGVESEGMICSPLELKYSERSKKRTTIK